MTASVRLYARPYGTGVRWRIEAGDLSLEHSDRAFLLPKARALAAEMHTDLVVSDAPEQLTLTKDDGITQALSGTDARWAEVCDSAISRLAETGRSFTAFDLIAAGVPEPAHPNHWGARISLAARRGVIQAIDYAPSARPTTRHSAARVWRGTHLEAIA